MIDFDRVGLTYDDATTPTLEQVSFHIPEGDLCVVIGRTGSGKSTLLAAINGLVPHFTGGRLSGQVRVAGRVTARTRPRDLADVVGYVGQDPLAGFVSDTVEEEIAYGMEQLGLAPDTMRKRVEESLDLLGIAQLRRRALIDLSGGQQQRVAIAAVMAAQPRILVLDEPTSALDPTAAQEVLAAITALVHEVGLTVLVAEHRLERVMHVADSMLWLPGDATVEHGPPEEILATADVAPPLAQLARVLGWTQVPLSVRQARRRVHREHVIATPPPPPAAPGGPAIAGVAGLTVVHGSVLAVHQVDLELQAGTITALMGRNGAGKSSLLWAMQGSGPRTTGRAWVGADRLDPGQLTPKQARRLICLVPQGASDLLYLDTVGQECAQADRETGADHGATASLLETLGADLEPDSHPRDLSEGQRLALVLAVQLVAGPRVILLDEPTRGLDYTMKATLAGICRDLADRGAAVVISTHDVEFAAVATDRTVILADGEVVADGSTREVCTSSPVFSPQVAKVFRPVPLLTVDDVRTGLRQGAS